LNLIWPGEAFPSVIANSTLVSREAADAQPRHMHRGPAAYDIVCTPVALNRLYEFSLCCPGPA